MGRGYDIKYKSKGMVLRDLQDIGVAKNIANKIAKGVGKRGRVAKAFIVVSKSTNFKYLTLFLVPQRGDLILETVL